MGEVQLKNDGELRRKMGFFSVLAIGVGAVVGDGVFLMVADGAANAGPACVISYMIAGVLLFCVSMSCVELAIGMPVAGGLHDWNKRMLGPRWGIIAAFGNAVMNLIFLGSVGLGTGYISNHFFLWTANEDISAVIWGCLILGILYVITLIGGDVTGKFQFALVVILVGIMVAFTVAGLASGRTSSANLEPFAPFGFNGIWLGIMAGVYAFMGPMSLLTTSGEIKEAKILPKAMLWTFIMILAIYLAAMLVCMALVDYKTFSTMDSPFTVAAEMIFGNAAGMVINVGAWIACITCLIAEYFTVSRVLYGMAEQKVVPAVFGKANKNGVPFVGLTLGLVVGVLLVLMGVIPALGTVYTFLGGMSCACGVLCMFFTVLSGWIYKKKFPEEHAALEWHLPLRNVVSCIGLIGTIILFAASFQNNLPTVIGMVVIIILFVLYYEFYAKKRSIE